MKDENNFCSHKNTRNNNFIPVPWTLVEKLEF